MQVSKCGTRACVGVVVLGRVCMVSATLMYLHVVYELFSFTGCRHEFASHKWKKKKGTSKANSNNCDVNDQTENTGNNLSESTDMGEQENCKVILYNDEV